MSRLEHEELRLQARALPSDDSRRLVALGHLSAASSWLDSADNELAKARKALDQQPDEESGTMRLEWL